MNTPKEIVKQYEKALSFKQSLGDKGLYRQCETNRRFFMGDQWYGASIGADKPLVRHNIVRRIGDYKMGSLIKSKPRIEFSAEGVSYTLSDKASLKQLKENMSSGAVTLNNSPDDNEIRLLTDALSHYFKVTKDRLRFDSLESDILKNSFITGTGVLYSYWDSFADNGKGNIACEVLPIENIYFGDFYETDIEKQPYIIIVKNSDTSAVRKTAEGFSMPTDKITSDDNSGKTRVYTKLYKEFDGKDYKIMATSVTDKAFVRPPYDTGLSRYPLNIFCWEKSENCIYGGSEITYLIPNQIAINRMLTASVWASMNMGMPIMTVNGDTVTGDITNDPGQIIKIFGTNEDVKGAINFVTPPDFSTNFQNGISSLIENTLLSNGAGITALIKNNFNTAAIENISAVTEISKESLFIRFSAFLEDIALLWLDFWIKKYGKRQILIEDENGAWYFPFDASRYKNISFHAKAVKENDNETN